MKYIDSLANFLGYIKYVPKFKGILSFLNKYPESGFIDI